MIKLLEKSNEFNEEIKDSVVLVDFFATWCGPCKMLMPVLEGYEKSHPELKILKVDIDLYPELAKEYAIMSVPTLLVFKDGKLQKKDSGFKNTTELDSFLR